MFIVFSGKLSTLVSFFPEIGPCQVCLEGAHFGKTVFKPFGFNLFLFSSSILHKHGFVVEQINLFSRQGFLVSGLGEQYG